MQTPNSAQSKEILERLVKEQKLSPQKRLDGGMHGVEIEVEEVSMNLPGIGHKKIYLSLEKILQMIDEMLKNGICQKNIETEMRTYTVSTGGNYYDYYQGVYRKNFYWEFLCREDEITLKLLNGQPVLTTRFLKSYTI